MLARGDKFLGQDAPGPRHAWCKSVSKEGGAGLDASGQRFGSLSGTDSRKNRVLSVSHRDAPGLTRSGPEAETQTASVHGVSGTLPISWVSGPSAGNRHPLLQVLTLFKVATSRVCSASPTARSAWLRKSAQGLFEKTQGRRGEPRDPPA